MKLPPPVVFLSAIAAVALIIGAFGSLLLPRLVDSQLIRDRISAELAQRSAGSVIIGRVSVPGFPLRVVMDRLEVSFGDRIEGTIQSVEIFPSMLPLLAGRLVMRRMLLEQPKIRIRLPESSGKPFELDALEEQVRSVLIGAARELRTSRIEVSGGSAEITMGDREPVILENVSAYTVASPAELRLEFSARSNLCEKITIEGEIVPNTLASRLDIGFKRLRIKELLKILPLPIPGSAQNGEASLDLKITGAGLRQVKASIDGTAGAVVSTRHAGTASIEVKRMRAAILYDRDAFVVQMVQLELGRPRLQASGELKVQPGLSSARLRVRNVDVAEVGDVALRMVDDGEMVRRMLRYIPAGTISELAIHSTGRSFAEMTSRKNVLISGLLHDCKILIPAAHLELQNVTGSVRISGRAFEADGVSATLGAIKGWNGKLRLGLEGKSAPFHLDVSVRSAAPAVYSVLLKLVQDEAFRRELLKLRSLQGELAGRLILGESLDAIAPVAIISDANITASYAPIPLPIMIERGRFSYDQSFIRVENAAGAVGRSPFAGLSTTLDRTASRRIKIDIARVVLDLEEAASLLRLFDDARTELTKFGPARGKIAFENLSVAGAFDDPSDWKFASRGRFDQIEITHADLPGPMTLARGNFAASDAKINVSETAMTVSDASLLGAADLEYANRRPRLVRADGTATIGAEMIQWLSERVELPKDVRLRAPVTVTAGHLAWPAGSEIAFDGQVIAGGGAQLSLRAVKHPQGLSLRDVTIQDGSRRARVTLERADKNLDFSFRGELMQETIDKVFTSFPTQDSSLRGDIRVNVSLERPARVSARGHLDGGNLWLPFRGEKALVENFNIHASGESFLLRSADLRWRNNRLNVSGKAVAAEEILRVDLDVTGDQLNWEDFQPSFGKQARQREETRGALAMPSVEGTIRVKTPLFTFERFNLNLLEAAVTISTSGVVVDIDHAIICGMTVSGRVDSLGDETGVELRLAALRAQLEPTTVCLTNRQNDVTGTYSLQARVLARGDREKLLSTVRGSFDLTAHDGEFIRSPGIDATFDYLNASGDFRIAFPDLDRQTFPYRLITLKGKMQGEILVGEEVIVQSSLVNLTGYGNVDLAEKTIEGKGLIAVLKPIDEVIGRIPLMSSLWAGSLVGIPVRVTGSLDRPDISYLAPADVGAELLNIPVRILGIPIGAMRLFAPGRRLD